MKTLLELQRIALNTGKQTPHAPIEPRRERRRREKRTTATNNGENRRRFTKYSM